MQTATVVISPSLSLSLGAVGIFTWNCWMLMNYWNFWMIFRYLVDFSNIMNTHRHYLVAATCSHPSESRQISILLFAIRAFFQHMKSENISNSEKKMKKKKQK